MQHFLLIGNLGMFWAGIALLQEWLCCLWELVSARFPCPAHILRVNPCPLGQLGGTVSCLKPSQFTGPFKVSTPTRAPQDYKNYKRQQSGLHTDAHVHACMHAHKPTVNCPFIWRQTTAKKKYIIKASYMSLQFLLPADVGMSYREYFFFFRGKI